MFEATIHRYRATYDEQDGWRCDEKQVEKFLRRNCTPGVEPDPEQVNVDARKALSTPSDHLEHASLLAAEQFFGAYVRLEAKPEPIIEPVTEPVIDVAPVAR